VLLVVFTVFLSSDSPMIIPKKEEEINALHDTTTVAQTAWKVGKDAVEAGTNLVPVCVP
jgi:hypothetical protein